MPFRNLNSYFGVIIHDPVTAFAAVFCVHFVFLDTNVVVNSFLDTEHNHWSHNEGDMVI